jgi:hypothetical protein
MDSAKATYAVPRILWENLENVFNNEARRYVKDLAAVLDVPADKLLQKVFPKKSTVKVYIQDTPVDDEDLCCRAFVEAGAVAARCRRPVMLGTSHCCHHQYYRPEVNQAISGSKKLMRLATAADLPTLWYDDNGTVYDADLNIRGHYMIDSGSLQLFSSPSSM